IGFNTYISFRAVPIIFFPAFLLSLGSLFQKRGHLQKGAVLKELSRWALLGIAAFVVFLPLLSYFAANPGTFFGRAGQVAISSSEHPVVTLLTSTVKTLGMFNIVGDGNWRHNFAGRAQLILPVGAAFLVGLIYTGLYAFRAVRHARWEAGAVPIILIIAFPATLLACFLSREGIPHALRAIGSIPIVYTFAGFGGLIIGEYFLRTLAGSPARLRLAQALGALVMLGIMFSEITTYFVLWGRNPEVRGSFTTYFTEIARLLNTHQRDTTHYVIVNESGVLAPVRQADGSVRELPMSVQPIVYQTYGKSAVIYLTPEDIPRIPSVIGPALFIPLRPDPNIFSTLEQRYPHGSIARTGNVSWFSLNE
ncbi:MAG: hypothetical protein HY460_00760, partial [Parcubacteria group bacterium]|nr:hypothetical protein [Parcubacteria group bacterium]